MHRLILVLCLYLSSCLPAQAADTLWMCTGYTNPDATPYVLHWDSTSRKLQVYKEGGHLSFEVYLNEYEEVQDANGFTGAVTQDNTTYVIIFFKHLPTNAVFFGVSTIDTESIAMWECA